MREQRRKKLEMFQRASGIPCAVYGADGKLCAVYSRTNAPSGAEPKFAGNLLQGLMVRLAPYQVPWFSIGKQDQYYYLMIPVSDAEGMETVVAGPFTVSGGEREECIGVPVASTEELEQTGRLLLTLLLPVNDVDGIIPIYMDTEFNPFRLEQFVIDSKEYVAENLLRNPTMSGYEAVVQMVRDKDAAALKTLIRRLIESPLPEAVNPAHIQTPVSGHRLKKNILVNVFSTVDYIFTQQRSSSLFYLYLNAVILTRFENCRNDVDLVCAAFEVVDALFARDAADCRSGNHCVCEACFYVCSNLSRPIGIREVAAQVGLSESYFSRLFKSEMGTTFKQYVDQVKIEYSKNLLLYTKKPILEIGMAIAVEPESNFTSYFKKHTGTTPAKFRNMG